MSEYKKDSFFKVVQKIKDKKEISKVVLGYALSYGMQKMIFGSSKKNTLNANSRDVYFESTFLVFKEIYPALNEDDFVTFCMLRSIGKDKLVEMMSDGRLPDILTEKMIFNLHRFEKIKGEDKGA